MMKLRSTETSNRQEIWSRNDHIGDTVWNPVSNQWELDCTSVEEMITVDQLKQICKILDAKNSMIGGSVHG
jgi:hypothetical protein